MTRALATGILVGVALVAALVACAAKPSDERDVIVEHPTGTIPGALHGTVRTADDKPVPNALVTAASTDAPAQAVPELAVMTDADGRYEWPLKPGHYRLVVDVPGRGTGAVTVEVGHEPVLDITLAP